MEEQQNCLMFYFEIYVNGKPMTRYILIVNQANQGY